MRPSWRVRGKSLQLRYDAGKDINGERTVLYETVSDYNEKGRRLSDRQRDKLWEEFADRCKSGSVSSPSAMTVKDVVTHHVDTSLNMSPNTVRSHHYTIDKYLSDGFGSRKANKVSRSEAKAWVKWLTEQNSRTGQKLSPKTVANIIGLVSASYRTAMTEDLLNRNPFDRIPMPKVEKKEAKYYDLPTAMRFIQCLMAVPKEEYNYKVGILLAMMCGLRRGEVCGLTYEDVLESENLLKVRQSVYVEKGGERVPKAPKTPSGVRTVGVPSSLMEEIKKLNEYNAYKKSMMGSLWKDTPALIKSAYGDYMYPNVLYKWLTKFLKEHDLPHIGIHGLRHTYASMLVNMDLDIKTVSQTLGHSDIVVTDRYIHQFETKQNTIADQIDKFVANLLPNDGAESDIR